MVNIRETAITVRLTAAVDMSSRVSVTCSADSLVFSLSPSLFLFLCSQNRLPLSVSVSPVGWEILDENINQIFLIIFVVTIFLNAEEF